MMPFVHVRGFRWPDASFPNLRQSVDKERSAQIDAMMPKIDGENATVDHLHCGL
jgi:hypothetical protein